jgi:Tetracyclin repressor-like, C-terminal domain
MAALGQERGELHRSQDPKEIVAWIFGPLMYRRYFSREILNEAFAKRVVDSALRKAD